ncbi:hypothetical protein [Klebsiella aerogenes]|uniref:lysozyme inhibitor LprI family protein n=1 Tax=Klebsiella aerogenes TaxID=548 RepID=UPI002FF53A81
MSVKHRGKSMLFLVLFSALWLQQGRAASFDCAQAHTEDEVAVCHTPVLNDLDVQMATEYRLLRGLVAMGQAGNMVDDQRKWLVARRRCGSQEACLLTRYRERLRQLNDVYQGLDRPR